ncbi:glycosyltransferase [Brucepastera parasyntrophica]|uniref:glycosyltransferase family A protein n=1 Tax=Brucepastera parasyntrophica TaxID=2880008 RepID=UPI00210B6F16|nr:glycosyltransferase family 2 protein [Brucepastera parasyntrophica]ULQ60678.1 glycosyltransferase [Brucepastera parasyntrophica]
MKDTVKFSVIIPSYNTSNYLETCIKSVIAQNYENWELFIIDQSNDNSYEIAKQYERLYPQKIFVEKIQKAGVSHARNVGISKASGEYIFFLDSDDYMQGELFTYINNVNKKKNIDCFIGGFDCIVEDERRTPLNPESINYRKINNQSQEKVLNYLYRIRLLHTVWRFVVKRKIIQDNKLFFNEAITYEDEEWVPQMLLLATTYSHIKFHHYVHRRRQGSITSFNDSNKYHSMSAVANKLLDLSETQEFEYQKLFLLRNAYKMFEMCYWGIRELSKPMKSLKLKKKWK